MNTPYHKLRNSVNAVSKWLIPYARSRILCRQFRPVLSYLFTEWNCNIDCHYCWDFNNAKKGMALETAKSAIDWLHSTGCRVAAIMGGEPLLRPDFIVEVIRYGKSRGMFMYLPTNGFLLDGKLINRLGSAGVSAINLAIDVVEPKPGLPKAFRTVERQFNMLMRLQKRYGYIVFFNINITGRNLDDVRQLTEIARKNGIGTDYHVCEPPLVRQRHRMGKGDALYIRPSQLRKFDRLIDWLVQKNREGYPMVNPAAQILEMKAFVRHRNRKWGCRAGVNGSFICADGSVRPCFEMMCSKEDWGRIWAPKFDRKRLEEMKEKCTERCLSTCYRTMEHYYNPRTIFRWVLNHSRIS